MGRKISLSRAQGVPGGNPGGEPYHGFMAAEKPRTGYTHVKTLYFRVWEKQRCFSRDPTGTMEVRKGKGT